MTRCSINLTSAQHILRQIGNTPTIELLHPIVPKGKNLVLKLEYENPTFSIKDRTAYGLVQKAMQRGSLRPGGTIIESSSGNLGKSLAMISASLRFHLIVVVDTKVSNHNLNWYRAYGADIELITDCGTYDSMQAARIARVKELLAKFLDTYWPNQHENCDNVEYHAEHTASEYMQEDFDCLVGCLSTGGHLTRIAKGLKKLGKKSKEVMACDVVGSAIFGKPFHPYLLNGVGLAWRTANTDLSNFDYLMSVPDDQAISLCRLVASECGLLLGGGGRVKHFWCVGPATSNNLKPCYGNRTGLYIQLSGSFL